MKIMAVTVAGLALAGVTGASAQEYPVPVYGAAVYPYGGLYMAAPVGIGVAPVVAASPYYGAGYVPGPVPGSVVVNAYTGRWCTFQPDGWHWCWTP
ncbi:MAG TPA: hypothetical protein VGG11_04125 [Xanthobacteraceae bacterium]|jgi:hypothetical protein